LQGHGLEDGVTIGALMAIKNSLSKKEYLIDSVCRDTGWRME
jgi:hypothetical protein